MALPLFTAPLSGIAHRNEVCDITDRDLASGLRCGPELVGRILDILLAGQMQPVQPVPL